MTKKIPEPTQPPRERAFLVGVELKQHPGLLSLEDSLAELELLADTAGLDVVGEATQRIDRPNPETYIGSGKVEEIKILIEESLANVAIFDNELSPRHLRELELLFGPNIHVVDRTALILDIFAQHAHTREGILQVELAQSEYRLPRLTRAWVHLARQTGGAAGRTGTVGGVGLRGPGETQLEVDRREIRHRITKLKQELDKVRAHRQRYRAQRKRTQIPLIALVGYTNAGKSTLLNKLSNSKVQVADKLFATLDPTTRRVEITPSNSGLFTDTVGFIQKLPAQLIAAFRATLEEIAEADLLIHVVDISHPNAVEQWKSVQQTLAEIHADHIPVITALNKLDRLPDQQNAQLILTHFPNSVAISAKIGTGIDNLLSIVHNHLFETFTPLIVKIPSQQSQLIALFQQQCQPTLIESTHGSVILHGNIPGRLLAQFQDYVYKEQEPED